MVQFSKAALSERLAASAIWEAEHCQANRSSVHTEWRLFSLFCLHTRHTFWDKTELRWQRIKNLTKLGYTLPGDPSAALMFGTGGTVPRDVSGSCTRRTSRTSCGSVVLGAGEAEAPPKPEPRLGVGG